jgi:hypothetical protein
MERRLTDGRLCEVILAAKRNLKAHACPDGFQLPSHIGVCFYGTAATAPFYQKQPRTHHIVKSFQFLPFTSHDDIQLHHLAR